MNVMASPCVITKQRVTQTQIASNPPEANLLSEEPEKRSAPYKVWPAVSSEDREPKGRGVV